MGCGSTDRGEEEYKLLQLPDIELDLEQADKMPEDHFFGMPAESRDIEGEIDQSKPVPPAQKRAEEYHASPAESRGMASQSRNQTCQTKPARGRPPGSIPRSCQGK